MDNIDIRYQGTYDYYRKYAVLSMTEGRCVFACAFHHFLTPPRPLSPSLPLCVCLHCGAFAVRTQSRCTVAKITIERQYDDLPDFFDCGAVRWTQSGRPPCSYQRRRGNNVAHSEHVQSEQSDSLRKVMSVFVFDGKPLSNRESLKRQGFAKRHNRSVRIEKTLKSR
jgi:hypothetical protein